MLSAPARVTRSLWHYGLLALCLGLLAACLVYPIVLTVRGGFAVDPKDFAKGLTLDHVRMIFDDPTLRAGLMSSFKSAACTTLGATLIALPLADVAAKFTAGQAIAA